jgi:hypothetical protein
VLILLLDQWDKSFNTFGIGDIKGFDMDVGSRVFDKDLVTSFVGKLNISAGHDDVPVGCFGKIIDDSIANAFVGAGDNNVSDLLH